MIGGVTLDGIAIYTAPGETPDLEDALGCELHAVEVDHLSEVRPGREPAILVLSAALVDNGTGADLLDLPPHVVVVATDDRARRLGESTGRLFMAAEELSGEAGLRRGMAAAASHAVACRTLEDHRRTVEASVRGLGELDRAGAALASEEDRERLLDLVVEHARRLTGSDAGRLHLAEGTPDGAPRLRLVRSAYRSLPRDAWGAAAAESPIAEYAAVTGDAVVVDDAYDLPDGAPYAFDAGFDRKHGYRTRSVLAVPLAKAAGGVLGVIELLNRTRTAGDTNGSEGDAERCVLPYAQRDVVLMRCLARVAAMSLEGERPDSSARRRGPTE